MKFNKWTLALAATGVVSIAAQADESHPVNTLLSSTTLSGFVDTGANWNFGSGKTQAARFVNSDSSTLDGFNLNAVKIALEKPLDEGTWSAGYKAELLYGHDATGLPGRLGGADAAIKQAYVALRAPIGNGIDFKVGQYDPIIGYEVVDTYANPNFSRSFGFALEPLSHTGVLATYQFTDWLGASAGVANTHFGGYNAKVNPESLKTFQTGIVVKAPESTGWLSGSSLYAGIIDGGLNSAKDGVSYYVGASLSTPVKELSLGVAYDYVANVDGTGAAWAGTATGYGNAVTVYASYQITEKLKGNLRGEYATSSGGYFLAGRNDEKLTGVTATLDYALWANVVTRAEFRWDHIAGGKGGTGFDGQKNDTSVTANIIYKF